MEARWFLTVSADLGVRRRRQDGHAQVDGAAHFLGVGQDGFEALGKELLHLGDLDSHVVFGLVENEPDVVRWDLQLLERGEEDSEVPNAGQVEGGHDEESLGTLEGS